jgi:hypothetical protein
VRRFLYRNMNTHHTTELEYRLDIRESRSDFLNNIHNVYCSRKNAFDHTKTNIMTLGCLDKKLFMCYPQNCW